MRSLQQATTLDKVQKLLGVRHTSLGSLSEATGVFDATPLLDIVQELAATALPLEQGSTAVALQGLTAVDGTILKALPKMAWALWMDERHRGAKMHLHFSVLKGVPVDATLTAAACSEPASNCVPPCRPAASTSSTAAMPTINCSATSSTPTRR
jgi:hypothetical protein